MQVAHTLKIYQTGTRKILCRSTTVITKQNKLQDAKIDINSIRQTKAGNVLLESGKLKYKSGLETLRGWSGKQLQQRI